MQRIITLSADIAQSAKTIVSLPLGQRRNMQVDRLQAMLVPSITTGTDGPTKDQLEAVELQVGLQLWLDQNQQDAMIPQALPVRAIRFLDPGPVPIVPFQLLDKNQLTLQWTAFTAALWTSTAFLAADSWKLNLILWGNDDYKA
ncbi:MAG TPA: hypothetical protein VFT46_07150 [Holophagaceae bacterium]|nr:hypothetical protein [Holophagaceae bacterium]